MMRAAAMRRELPAARHIPYAAHVAPDLIVTAHGDYMQTFRMSGASFESADDETLNNWHERLNVTWRNIDSPNLAVWTHLIRRRDVPEMAAIRGNGFADSLARRYRQRLAGETLMLNEIYLTLVYRPVRGAAPTLASKFMSRRQKGNGREDRLDAIEVCTKLRQTVSASLARYEPESLKVYAFNCRHHSALLEFLSLLMNGEAARVPLPRSPLDAALATSRVLIGSETLEYRTVSETRFGAILGIKEYPTPSVAGMYDSLLSAPFSFALTKSFAFLSKAAGQGLLQRQHARMGNAGDFSLSQAE